jgi:acetyltransferase-like isoleucine patch superfamily enzyme
MLRKLIFFVRDNVIKLRIHLMRMRGADIHPEARISFKARVDFTNPKGVHIAKGAHVTFDAIVLTHDFSRGKWFDTYIGENTFIGAGAIVMPGVRIGRECIIGSGSVVTKDIPDNSMAVGNPARVIKTGIHVAKLGRLKEVDK